MDNYNFRMLTIARESRKMSQSIFANVAGYSQANISKLENGLINITNNVISKYMEVLNYNESFFKRKYEPNFTLVNYRKNSKLGIKKQTHIEAIFNIIISNIKIILREVDITYKNLKIPTDVDNTPIEIANQIRDMLNIPIGPVVNLTNYLENVGIFIVELDLDMNFNGAMKQLDDLNIIFINKNLPADRYRFTVAHELGHLVMHDYQGSDAEEQANDFASELLMPSRVIKQELNAYNRLGTRQLEELKYRWMTSMMSIIFRAKSLDIIDKEETGKLYRMLYANKRIHNKVEVLQLQKEKPKLLSILYKYFINNLEYSDNDLEKLFGISTKELTTLFNIKKETKVFKMRE